MEKQHMVKEFLQQYDIGDKQIEFPGFLKEYHILSCIYDKTEKSCYLVTDQKSDEKYLLKINRNQNGCGILKAEHQKLCQLSEAFPKEYRSSVYQEENGTEYLLKHYIPGMDLEDYQERNRPLSVQEVLRLAIQICEIVEKLHTLTPPILHRDIKPKNLIIDYKGSPHLIDFETARNYCENKSKDTVLLGTEGNAAPEQYGYSQTDVRTDIFGIGKVLEFLCVENDICKIKNARTRKQIKNITATATAFDPAHRYQSVFMLKCALKKVLRRVDEGYLLKKIHIIGTVEAVTAVLLLFAAFWEAGIFYQKPSSAELKTGKTPDILKSSETKTPFPVAEASPEKSDKADEESSEKESGPLRQSDGQPLFHTGDMEDVVKTITGKNKIGQKDYEQITKIAVIGNQIYEAEIGLEDMVDCMGFEENLINGGITDISLLSKMPNLKEIFLCDQKITDISPLKGLPIEKLYLSGNQISDFSVIETLEQLNVLFIVDNPVSILPDLSKLKQFVRLNLSGNIYENLDFLKESTVGSLDIRHIYVKSDDFSVLRSMANLSDLRTAENQQTFYAELPKLNQLTELGLWGYRGNDLSIIKSLSKLERLYTSGRALESLSGIESASNLRQLHIDGTVITDISNIEELKLITYFKICGNDINDYTPLFRCNSLQFVNADEKQKREIERINPEHNFQIINE